MLYLLLLAVGLANAKPDRSHFKPIEIPAGKFAPLYGLNKDQKDFDVPGFRLDQVPVTQTAFQKFLKTHPEWKKGKPVQMLAESRYLENWKASEPPKGMAQSPVTFVSWFAAQAFCEAQGGRLPTTLEWEYVAAASPLAVDSQNDPVFNAQILAWYSKPVDPKGVKAKIAQTSPNYYNLHDLHGLIWEWTLDFNSAIMTSDNRQDGDVTKDLFCGNSVSGAINRSNYAGFMRYAMRSSLNASDALPALGFRCAYDLRENAKGEGR